MIKFETKFKPGDKVYVLVQVPVKITCKCDLCENTGKIEHNGVPMLCPKCKGKKLVKETKYLCWEVIDEPLIISSIRLKYHSEKNYTVGYNVGGYKRSGENLFSSKEEAINMCNVLNKALANADSEEKKSIESNKNKFEIDTKFNLNDSVYTVERKKRFNGSVRLKPINKELSVDSIRLTIKKDSINVRYRVAGLNRQEKNVFFTLSEAKSACAKANKFIG